jgi:hypothetical protein
MAANGMHGMPLSAPYPPRTAGVGGVPTLTVDVPITAVFMVIYLGLAAANMAIFQKNRKQDHKFLISWMLFAFSMARVVTCIMRIVWATRQHDVQVAIAAQIFNNAGVLIVYLVNLIFAQRVLRAMHPKFGWNTALSHVFHVAYGLLVGTLIMVITATVIMFYTLNPHTIQACIDCQRAATIFLFFLTTTPLLLLAASFLLPRSGAREETFGVGTVNGKAVLLVATACLAVTISGFKLGTTWESPRPMNDPAWYHSKAAFYCFGFMLEIMILGIYVVGRVDKRFHIPNGSAKRRSYMMEPLPEKASSDGSESA